ncbi:MAG: hypothetical protein JNL42_01560 [Anaerolineae bacterium]|nr:hypothetical protein [Anaerolineae bacterium]
MMKTVTLKGHIDDAGQLELEQPLALKSVNVLVTITFDAVESEDVADESAESMVFSGKSAEDILASGLIGSCEGTDSWGGGDAAEWVEAHRRARRDRYTW